MSVVSIEEIGNIECLDDETVLKLNLLYWSVVSQNAHSVSECIEFLRKRNLLTIEVNKKYPNATVFDLAIRLKDSNNRNQILQILLGVKENEKSTLLNKFDDQNIFEYSLDFRFSSEAFLLLFSDHELTTTEKCRKVALSNERCDAFFMDFLGFVVGESQARRIEKYKIWKGDILFNAVKMDNLKAFLLAIDILKRYNYIFDYELKGIKNNKTLLQAAILRAFAFSGKCLLPRH